jgi:hypothetical protein
MRGAIEQVTLNHRRPDIAIQASLDDPERRVNRVSDTSGVNVFNVHHASLTGRFSSARTLYVRTFDCFFDI